MPVIPMEIPQFQPLAKNAYERGWNDCRLFLIELERQVKDKEFIEDFFRRHRTQVEKEKGSPALPK